MGSGYPTGNTGNASQFVDEAINVIIVDPDPDQRRDLSGVAIRCVHVDRRWPELDRRDWDLRGHALDGARPLHANERADPVRGGRAGTGVFQSTDGGATFTQILIATTPALAAALAGGSFVRVVVALAPPASPPDVKGVQVIYVTLSAGYGAAHDPVGLFLSKDQGQTWTQQTATGMSGNTYGGYALDMAVDPASPGDGSNDVIYLGCLPQFKSTNSGGSFSGLSVGHVDTHTWTLVPGSGGANTTVYCGNDGGIDVSTDNGATWTPLNGGGLQPPVLQHRGQARRDR